MCFPAFSRSSVVILWHVSHIVVVFMSFDSPRNLYRLQLLSKCPGRMDFEGRWARLRRRIPRKSPFQVLLVLVHTDVRLDTRLAPCRATGIDPNDLRQNSGPFAVTIVYIYVGQPCFPFAGLRQSQDMGY